MSNYNLTPYQGIGTSVNMNRDRIDLENSIRSYTMMCKTNDNSTVRQVIDGIRSKYDSRMIARNNCVSINTIDRARILYNHVGGDMMIEIADKLCMRGGTKEKLNGTAKQKSVEEHIETFNKGVDSANRAIESGTKAAELAIATATALSGLFRKAKEGLGEQHSGPKTQQPKKKLTVKDMSVDDDNQEIDENDVTPNPSSKEDVLKNILFLQEQISSKDEQIITKEAELAKKTKELAETNFKLQSANAKAMALEAKLKQTIIKYQQTHQLQIKKVAADVAAGKDLECGKKLIAAKQSDF